MEVEFCPLNETSKEKVIPVVVARSEVSEMEELLVVVAWSETSVGLLIRSTFMVGSSA